MTDARGAALARPEPVVYPDHDDQPMSDNDANWWRMVDASTALMRAMRQRGRTAYVSSDLFVYPVEGDNTVRCAPDVLVAPGCSSDERRSFLCWEEPVPITFAGEFLAAGVSIDGALAKRQLAFYRERLSLPEVFFYASHRRDAEWFAFRLLRRGPGGSYRPVRPDGEGWYRSAALDLELQPTIAGLDWRDPSTHERYLPDRRRAEAEARRADAEARARIHAEARAAALEAELVRLRRSRPTED